MHFRKAAFPPTPTFSELQNAPVFPSPAEQRLLDQDGFLKTPIKIFLGSPHFENKIPTHFKVKKQYCTF